MAVGLLVCSNPSPAGLDRPALSGAGLDKPAFSGAGAALDSPIPTAPIAYIRGSKYTNDQVELLNTAKPAVFLELFGTRDYTVNPVVVQDYMEHRYKFTALAHQNQVQKVLCSSLYAPLNVEHKYKFTA